MNKTEKIICLLLGAVLAWYLISESGKSKEQASAQAEAESTNQVVEVAAPAPEAGPAAESAPQAKAPETLPPPAIPEEIVVLENDDVKLELSTWGAVVKKATLKKYATECGSVSEDNPPVALDFSESPLGALHGVGGLAPNSAYKVESRSSNEVVFANAMATRRVTLADGYRILYDERFASTSSAPQQSNGGSISLGVMRMGDSKNDLLSVDSLELFGGRKGNKRVVVHHGDDDSSLKPYLVGGLAGGCSGSKSAAGMPDRTSVAYEGAQGWVAVKNRFFVTALYAAAAQGKDAYVDGFVADIARDVKSANYRPDSIAVNARFRDCTSERSVSFYVGPKKQALLWDLGMKDVMEFGMWRWLCYPLVWVLNLFNDWIPNYGVAIILLTILVRLLFWPLTHKSTVGMKKMQELQPKMKEIQAKFKDNPQRLQQETWALYKSEKVNPMSSCLPMLIQIPVFIALFNVLRSAVELRYAPFLWISDLSEPEGLFAAYLPFGGLNLLPILMAVSTGLQSAFTPSAGDKSQQRMMMIFMPLMMLVMFYSFPSALSLYWFLSNLFSIGQMWLIRRAAAKERKAA